MEPKIFVYDISGTLQYESSISAMAEVMLDINTHNQGVTNSEKYFMSLGLSFPPPGKKLVENGEFIDKTLREKYNDGEYQLVLGYKFFDDNSVVPMNNKDRIDAGILVLKSDEKYDDENDVIVKMNEKEKYESGVISFSDLCELITRRMVDKTNELIETFNYRYPKEEVSYFADKATQAYNWMALSNGEKETALTTVEPNYLLNKFGFLLGALSSSEELVTTEQKITAIDSKASAITNKRTRFQNLCVACESIRTGVEEQLLTMQNSTYDEIIAVYDNIVWPDPWV